MPCGYTEEEISDPTLNSMYKPAKRAPAPNYFGQLPPPQRGGGGGGDEDEKESSQKVKSCAQQFCKKFSTPCISNKNRWISM